MSKYLNPDAKFIVSCEWAEGSSTMTVRELLDGRDEGDEEVLEVARRISRTPVGASFCITIPFNGWEYYRRIG